MSHDASSPFSDDDHYRCLRSRLIRFFAAHGCPSAADLADDTLMRVLQTHAERHADCSVDRWTFAVARNVLRESRRASWRTVQFDADSRVLDAFHYLPETSKLEVDLLPLKPSERALLYSYYVERNHARVLAGRCGISEGAIRGRAHRVMNRVRLRLQLGCQQAAKRRTTPADSGAAKSEAR